MASMPWRSPQCGSPSGARPSLALVRSSGATRHRVSSQRTAALTLRLLSGLSFGWGHLTLSQLASCFTLTPEPRRTTQP